MSWGSPQGRPRGWGPQYGSPGWGMSPQGYRQNFQGPRQPRPPYGGWGSYVEGYGGNYGAGPYMGGGPRMPYPPQQNSQDENGDQEGEGEPAAPGDDSEEQPVNPMYQMQQGQMHGGPPHQWGGGMGYRMPGFNPYPSQLLAHNNQQGDMGGKKKKKKKGKAGGGGGGGAAQAANPPLMPQVTPSLPLSVGLQLPPPPPPPPPESIPTPPGPPPPPKPAASGPPESQNPGNWPPSLQNYVSRCYAKAKTEIDKDQVEIILKGKITKAAGDGSLWAKDWDHEPLPSTLSVDPKIGKGFGQAPSQRGPIKFGLAAAGKGGLGRNSFRSARSPLSSASSSRRRRRTSTDSSSSSESRQPASRRHRSPDYGGNANLVPLGGKGKSSPGSKFKGSKLGGGGAAGLSSKLQQKRKLLKGRAKGRGGGGEDVDNDNSADGDDDVPYFYTDGRKRMSLDADLASKEKRQKRAARFATTTANQPSNRGGPGARKKSLNLIASLSINMTLTADFEESNMQWENLHIVGSCQDLEKRFLRLTSAPEAHMVRPVSVLKQSLKMVIEKWKTKQDYHYTCDQLKSIRQDLTVQGVRDEFTIRVYETHARVALEKCDTTEFNQCQSQLRMLYHDIGGDNRLEFTAYRILYYMYTKETLDITSALSELKDDEKKDECISHALKLRTAWSLQNYHRFFNLYRTAPKMSGYIIDWFIDRERKAALRIIIKSYVLAE